MQELKATLDVAGRFQNADLAAGYDGVFFGGCCQKNPCTLKYVIQQWFFLQQSLTVVTETGEQRNYHLHEARLQETIYVAVRCVKITTRVTAHTSPFFATHLLQANYDIHTR